MQAELNESRNRQKENDVQERFERLRMKPQGRFVVRYGNFEVREESDGYTVGDARRSEYEPRYGNIPRPALAALAAQDLCRWEQKILVTDEEKRADVEMQPTPCHKNIPVPTRPWVAQTNRLKAISIFKRKSQETPLDGEN